MEQQKPRSQLPTFFGAGIVIVVLVFGLLSITEKLRQLASSHQPQLIITAVSPGSKINVTASVISTDCENDTKIDYSLVDLTISGGKPPYELTITSSESKVFGPYPNINNSSPVQIKVYGGEFFIAQVQSSDDENWSGTIALPSEDNFCENAPTLTPVPTPEPILTATSISTNTQIVILNPSSTSKSNVSDNPTNTIIIVNSTNTSTNIGEPTTNPTQATATTQPQATATTQPQATATTQPQATATTQPQATATTQPQATATTQPQATATPINPNPRECEDGIDNDGDNLIDYPADNDCKKPSDPHEGK